MGLKDQRFSILMCADNKADTNTVYITEEFLVAPKKQYQCSKQSYYRRIRAFSGAAV